MPLCPAHLSNTSVEERRTIATLAQGEPFRAEVETPSARRWRTAQSANLTLPPGLRWSDPDAAQNEERRQTAGAGLSSRFD